MSTSDEKKRDAILKRMLNTPPTPHKPLGKKSRKPAVNPASEKKDGRAAGESKRARPGSKKRG